jgi:hypothetical protein
MTSPEPKNSQSPADGEVSQIVSADGQTVVTSEMFISDIKTPLSEEQYLERVEAILKVLGLPPLAEVNRMEAEAEAKKRAAKRRS